MRFILFLLLVGSGIANAQNQGSIPQQLRTQYTLDRLGMQGVGSGEVAYGLPQPPGMIIGDVYFDEKWNVGTILLEGTETLIEGYPLKYNLQDHSIEIKTKSGVKVLDSRKVSSIVWVDSLSGSPTYFLNGARFFEDQTPIAGLVEIVVDGKLPLISKTRLMIKEPDYVVALNVGSRDTKILKKTKYYLVEKQALIQISSKKKLLPYFGDKGDEIDNFIKVNKLDVKTEIGLKRVFEHYNGI